MDAHKLTWCGAQKKGIRLDEPNDALAQEYVQSAEETLLVLQDMTQQSNMWRATTKYYCEYFAVYAFLMKIGVVSEIHECTIELCTFLEKETVLEKGTAKTLKDDKKLRIDNQYYLKNVPVSVDKTLLRNFVLDLKERIRTITADEVKEVRQKVKAALGQHDDKSQSKVDSSQGT